MGRLSGPQPHVSPGPAKPKSGETKKGSVIVVKIKPWRPCDECGYSHDGQAITRAKYQVEVPGGTLYFCAHHFHEHEVVFFEHSYAIYDIREKAVAK